MILENDQRATILLVEDDLALAEMLRDRLTSRGYRVWHSVSTAEAEATVEEILPDLVILDLMLPDMYGLVLCANLADRIGVPIIVCSATRRKEDPILALKLGAIDFISKPFSCDELEIRIETTLRRAVPASGVVAPVPAIQNVGPLTIDRDRCRVTLGGQPVRLTPTEYRLLCLLAKQPNHVLSPEALARPVWGTYDLGIRRSLEVHLRRLRAKLNRGPVTPPGVTAVRGLGYQLAWEPPDTDGAVVPTRAVSPVRA